MRQTYSDFIFFWLSEFSVELSINEVNELGCCFSGFRFRYLDFIKTWAVIFRNVCFETRTRIGAFTKKTVSTLWFLYFLRLLNNCKIALENFSGYCLYILLSSQVQSLQTLELSQKKHFRFSGLNVLNWETLHEKLASRKRTRVSILFIKRKEKFPIFLTERLNADCNKVRIGDFKTISDFKERLTFAILSKVS